MDDINRDHILIDQIIKRQLIKHLYRNWGSPAIMSKKRKRNQTINRYDLIGLYAVDVYEDLDIDHHLDTIDLIEMALSR